MALPTGRRFRARAAISGSRDAARLPARRPRYKSHSPLSVLRVSRSSGRQPQDSAKPCAARLHSPPEPRAAASGGPRFSTTRDGWRVASFRATTASLRGEANESTPSNSRPASSSPRRNSLRKALSSPRSAFGGSSSTPISSRKSERPGISALSHKYVAFQSGPEASMQGAVRREYCTYWRGRQRRSGASGPLPKGAGPAACGRVASLGNGMRHCRRHAPCHTPQGTR